MGFSCLKRRNGQTSVRRAIKRSKATEGFFGLSVVYMKCLLIWGVLLVVDFLLEFRFEYLWAVWMLLRSVYDSFKFQGVVLAALFGGLAIASDIVCYMLVPSQCLFFLASSYVWVQYVSQTDRGICLPTVSLWLIFLYIEYAVRLRDVKQSSMPFTLDLCRPFAAHCVGYPVVTLGFGCKSYVQYRLRLKKQSQVRKQNEQYFDIVKEALPAELQQNTNGLCVSDSAAHENGLQADVQTDKTFDSTDAVATNSLTNGASLTSTLSNTAAHSHRRRNQNHSHVTTSASASSNASYMQLSSATVTNNVTGNSRESSTQRKPKAASNASDYAATLSNGLAASSECNGSSETSAPNKQQQPTAVKDEMIGRLESELRRLRNDLQSARYTESELRSQISIYEKHEREARETMQQLRHDRDTFETKLNGVQQKFNTEKQALDRQLREERRSRQSIEEKIAHVERERDELRSQIQSTQQQTSPNSAASQKGSNSQQAASGKECGGECRNAKKKLENENKQLRDQLVRKSDEFAKLDNEKQSISAYRQSQADQHERDLKQALERASHLEKMLSDENRLKMDLVAALGDAKRQLELARAASRARDQELAELQRAQEFIGALLPGFGLAAPAGGAGPAAGRLSAAESQLPQFLASQNGTSHSSPSSTPLPFVTQSSSYNPSQYNAVPSLATATTGGGPSSGLYQNSGLVYGAFGAISPFDMAPSPSPNAFSPAVSAAIDAQQRAQSPGAANTSQTSDSASAKSISS